MSRIITKYSDYAISTIQFFIDKINEDLDYRDIGGLTNRIIDKVKVTKQHPLVAFREAELNPNRRLDDIRAGLLPAIAVTPADAENESLMLGLSTKYEEIDDDFIDILKDWYNAGDRAIQAELLISKDQIDDIIREYNKADSNAMRAEIHEWQKNEKVNISLWSDSPDIDQIMYVIVDSILMDIAVGVVGDDSRIRNFSYRVTRGLTNFNFGRVLQGTEFSLTVTNIYSNFTILYDEKITEAVLDADHIVSGEEV